MRLCISRPLKTHLNCCHTKIRTLGEPRPKFVLLLCIFPNSSTWIMAAAVRTRGSHPFAGYNFYTYYCNFMLYGICDVHKFLWMAHWILSMSDIHLQLSKLLIVHYTLTIEYFPLSHSKLERNAKKIILDMDVDSNDQLTLPHAFPFTKKWTYRRLDRAAILLHAQWERKEYRPGWKWWIGSSTFE